MLDIPPCPCPAGPCEHFPYPAAGIILLCRQGKSGKPREKELRHLEIFAEGQERTKRLTPEEIKAAQEKLAAEMPPPGPGTQLKAILAELGIKPEGCGCNELAYQMDVWGVDGTRLNAERILTQLRAEWTKRGWLEAGSVAAKAIAAGLAFRVNPFDPAPGLLNEAIRRAEEKERGQPAAPNP